MLTTSATRLGPARCHLTCTTVPTLTSHHEPCAPASTNRVLSVTWYVQARRRRAAVKVRAASSRAVTVPPPLGDPKYAGTANADEPASVAAVTNPRRRNDRLDRIVPPCPLDLHPGWR